MKMNTSIQLMQKYAACPVCENSLLGEGNGTLAVDNNRFVRSCRCGWRIELGAQEIKQFEEDSKRFAELLAAETTQTKRGGQP
jgi:hypothetical protein